MDSLPPAVISKYQDMLSYFTFKPYNDEFVVMNKVL